MLRLAFVYGVIAAIVYWNIRGERMLPSNEHARVLAVLWLPALLAGAGYGLWHAVRFFTKATVIDTAIAFKQVGEWRYHNGRILAPPKPADAVDRAAQAEVDKLLESI